MTHRHPSPSRTPRALCGGAIAALCLGLAPAAVAQDGESEMPTQEVTFLSAEGEETGTATLTGTPHGLLIELDLQNLPPESWHGFHIHEEGSCDPEDGFKSAGGHFNPGDTKHGFFVDGSPHAGDMPNQYVAADGTLKAQVLNTFASLGEGDNDVSGRALLVHGGSDDYESQSSGDAGERIACAEID
ncbi:MAG: superoxide dismutase family protein [Roseovarius sp.]|uniref:superoxide dismutase family protein n=1 Tax=Roseovarius sp. TaxID=1486281 RepID=UPI0032EDF43D